MRFLPFALGALFVAVAPRAALAEEDDEWAEYHAPKPSFGVMTAYRSYAMADGAADQLVFAPTLELFPIRNIEIIAFAEGAATMATTCGACRATTVRAGAGVRWHPVTWAFDPWLGLSVSYGIAHTSGESAQYVSATWLDITSAAEVGFDIRASPTLRIGPLASAGVSSLQIPVDGNAEPPAPAGQLQLTAGARVVF